MKRRLRIWIICDLIQIYLRRNRLHAWDYGCSFVLGWAWASFSTRRCNHYSGEKWNHYFDFGCRLTMGLSGLPLG